MIILFIGLFFLFLNLLSLPFISYYFIIINYGLISLNESYIWTLQNYILIGSGLGIILANSRILSKIFISFFSDNETYVRKNISKKVLIIVFSSIISATSGFYLLLFLINLLNKNNLSYLLIVFIIINSLFAFLVSRSLKKEWQDKRYIANFNYLMISLINFINFLSGFLNLGFLNTNLSWQRKIGIERKFSISINYITTGFFFLAIGIINIFLFNLKINLFFLIVTLISFLIAFLLKNLIMIMTKKKLIVFSFFGYLNIITTVILLLFYL